MNWEEEDEKGNSGSRCSNIGIALLPLQSGGRYCENDKMRLQNLVGK